MYPEKDAKKKRGCYIVREVMLFEKNRDFQNHHEIGKLFRATTYFPPNKQERT